MKKMKSVLVIVILLAFVSFSESSKFIMFSVFASQSHLTTFYLVAEGLVKNGHEVTMVTGREPKNITGIKEVFIKTVYDSFSNNIEMSKEMIASIDPTSTVKKRNAWTMLVTVFPSLCSDVMDDEEFKKIVENGRQYDVAINNMFLNDCTFPFASHVANHVVILSAGGLFSTIAYHANIPHPLSYVSGVFAFEPPLTFLQRAGNAAFGMGFLALEYLMVYPKLNGMIQERYPGLPNVQEVKSNVSFLLLNQMTVVDGSMPSVPYAQDIGGIGIKKTKALTGEFKTFVDGVGPEGFIFVSLGSVVPEEHIPERYKKIFIEAFSKLPVKVIWKFKEKRSDIPSNVMTTKWAPQQDILAHPKCRAFLTHGGGSSSKEAMYHGVPTIGMPVFGDQNSNVARAVNKGCGVELSWLNLTVDNLLDRINEVLKNPSYTERSQHYSKLMKDQPGPSPQEKAVYWLEYVVRHDGAKHLRTAADHLNFFQYFLLDVIAAATLVLTLVIYVIYKLIRMICCRSKSGQQKGKKKVKKN